MRPDRVESIDALAEHPPGAGTAATLRARLGGFDDADTAGRAERLLEVLAEVRHSRLSIAKRYQVLRLCLSFASPLRTRLGEQAVASSLPPPWEQIRVARRCAGAYRLMADCFRSIAQDIAAQDAGPLTEANRLSHACYWGINCLGEYLIIRCERYLKAGTGVWRDIHKLYDLAASEGVEQLPLGRKPKQLRTVESVYKKVLLLGLSDPFQHPFHSVGRLYEKLDDWASLTYLASASRPSTRCLFVVDPRLDRPASPALSQAGLRPEFNQRWLVTKDLVTRLKQEYDTVISHSVEHFQRRGSSVDELSSIDFLRRMIVRWGIHPVRSGTRRKTARSCDLVAGLRSVCLALNDFRPLNLDGVESATRLSRMITGTFDDDRDDRTDDSPIQGAWEVEDESENGVKLVCRLSGRRGVEVDDLVAVRTGPARDWSVGTVHWAQADDSGDFALGVRLIRYSVRPVVIDPLQAEPDVSRSEGLLCVDNSGDGVSWFLICPPSEYYPAGAYLVRQPGGRGELAVEATNMVLASRSFVWFEVAKPQRRTVQGPRSTRHAVSPRTVHAPLSACGSPFNSDSSP